MDKRDLELLAYGLLQGKGNLGQNLGQTGLLMLQDRDQRKDRESRQKQQEMQQKMLQMQLEQQQQTIVDQQGIRSAYQNAYRPPQAQQTAPFQADTFPGEEQPQGLSTITQQASPGGMDFSKLQNGLFGAGAAGVQEAMRIAEMTRKQGPKFADINPKDFTPESVRKFQQSGNYADLMQAPKDQDISALIIRGPDGRPMVNQVALEAKKTIAAAGASRTNVSNAQEKEENKAFGSYLVKDLYAPAQELARARRKENALLGALEKNPLDTSKIAPITTTAAAWLSSMGANSGQMRELATNGQAFTAVAKDLVLTKQLAQKGPQTDSDAKRLEATVANIGNTREANALIIKYSKAVNQYDIDYADFLREYRRKNKTLDGADDAWFEGPGNRSVWDSPELKNAFPSQSGAPAQASGFSIQRIQ